MDNNASPREVRKLEQLSKLQQQKEENTPIYFQIIAIYQKGFKVRIGLLFAFIRFNFMPWKYSHRNCWEAVSPSLCGKQFKGYVFNIADPLHISIGANISQFAPFQYEIDKSYTAIVLEKRKRRLFVDFGYGLDWQYGSLTFRIIYPYNEDNEDIDLFPNYEVGDEFTAVYVGKSVLGNDIFCYDGVCFYSNEHILIGKNVWVALKRGENGSFFCQYHKEHDSELLLDEQDEAGLSPQFLQKTLQTIPDGERLLCKVVNVSYNGTLQLKWLIDVAAPLGDVLAVYSDASVLRVDDPLVSEEKKALINKMVWCEPIKGSQPKSFMFENKYKGTIAMDATLYTDISLLQIIHAINKIPDNQHLFCKIKGIYPDGTFKLQWIVKWDSRAEKLVFPNKFSQKITLETVVKKSDIIQHYFIGQTLWVKVVRYSGHKFAFFIDNQPIGRMVIDAKHYPNTPLKLIRMALKNVSVGQQLLCEVSDIFKHSIGIRWKIEEDPFAKQFQFTSNNEHNIEESVSVKKKQIRKKQRERYIGKTMWLEAKRNDKNELFFLIHDKYIGTIIPSEENYRGIDREPIKQALQTVLSGQILWCRVQRILPGPRMELRWVIEEDPFAEQFQFVSPKQIKNNDDHDIEDAEKAEKEIFEQPIAIEAEATTIVQSNNENTENPPRIGDVVWLEAQRNKKHELSFVVSNRYTGYIIIDEINYPNMYRIPIQRLLRSIPHGQAVLCMIRKILPCYRVELRWMIEEDPAAEILRSILNLNYSQTRDELLEDLFSKLEKKETEQTMIKKMIKTEIPNVKPTVVGKIDLDAINTKIKPTKKTKAELLQAAAEHRRIEKEKKIALKASTTKKKEESTEI